MTEIIVKTQNGDMVCETVGIRPPTVARPVTQPRRVSLVDLDGPVGEFLANALPFIAPNAFTVNNWKPKLATFITSKTTSFLCCGRAVGLAHLVQEPMSGQHEAHGLFILVAEGGTEDDANAVLKAQKQWARDLGIGYRPPLKDYSSLSQSKIQQLLRTEKREELWMPPLAKK